LVAEFIVFEKSRDFKGGTMSDKYTEKIPRFLLFILFLFLIILPTGWAKTKNPLVEKIQRGWRNITSPLLMGYIQELCSEKYAGRLTGTKGYNDSASWLAERLAKWQLKAGGDNGTYFQDFPDPYTLVLPGAELSLQLPVKEGKAQSKFYEMEKDFFPGSTSASGEVTAEVVYVGYGISAPELNYDEYRGLDVKGKIVLVEVEVPLDPGKQAAEFAKWKPYSFHQYKVQNAKVHGAAGMIYHYHIANPNCLYIKDLILTYVGTTVVRDIFQNSGKNYDQIVKKIKQTHREQSFATGKIVTLKNITEHHPEGVGKNVIAYMEGSDPLLKNETMILAAHLDHLGYNPLLLPGANDNASGVAVVMAVAESLAHFELRPCCSIAFVFFGAEEQGVRGSEFYLQHPPEMLKNVKALINLDGVGRGKKLMALAAKNYPELWKHFTAANSTLVHTAMSAEYFHNRARPRLDAARFMWAGVPTISFSANGAPDLPYSTYHTSHDAPDIITPEIMVDLSRLIFSAVVDTMSCK
jgi:hypothetical protein